MLAFHVGMRAAQGGAWPPLLLLLLLLKLASLLLLLLVMLVLQLLLLGFTVGTLGPCAPSVPGCISSGHAKLSPELLGASLMPPAAFTSVRAAARLCWGPSARATTAEQDSSC